jgi:Domain of unknown function (DUF1877)
MSMIGYLLRISSNELKKYQENSDLLESRIDVSLENDDPNMIDIDKSWDGINFLLTGNIVGDSDHPLEKVLFSMQYIDENQDLGYGPANFLYPDQVKELNDTISKISVNELSTKYDSKKMTELELYPTGLWQDNGVVNYLTDNFKTVQEFYALAVKENQAIITFLS